MERVPKVICYVIRDQALLVFRHRDHPAAGIQEPAGTVLPAEDPARAAVRETEEETGRAGFSAISQLGTREHRSRDRFAGVERRGLHERYFFLLAPPPGLPERWSHLAESGSGQGGFRSDFYWVPIDAELTLAGDQHALLGEALKATHARGGRPLSPELTQR